MNDALNTLAALWTPRTSTQHTREREIPDENQPSSTNVYSISSNIIFISYFFGCPTEFYVFDEIFVNIEMFFVDFLYSYREKVNLILVFQNINIGSVGQKLKQKSL